LKKTVLPSGRYTLEFSYRPDLHMNAGHIISMDRDENGKLRLYDPQIGKSFSENEIVKYVKRMDLTRFHPQVLRIDNQFINPNVANHIMEGYN
jgi:hypothetical protein